LNGGAARKKKQNSWLEKLRKFRKLLAAMIPIALKVLVLLVILLLIGKVAEAVGGTFHLLHGAYLSNEVVERIWP
jgi:hypothetical protein